MAGLIAKKRKPLAGARLIFELFLISIIGWLSYSLYGKEDDVANMIASKALTHSESIENHSDLPFVSILTAHQEGRHFLSSNILRNFENQNYPQERMELIIIDEGFSPCPLFDKIDKPNVRYFFHDLKRGQLKLGRVRNRLNRYAKGPLIVNMDSDDFYAPDYVKWKVKLWQDNPGSHLIGLNGITNAQISIDGALRLWFTTYDPNCADGWIFTKDAADRCIYRRNKKANEETSLRKCVIKNWGEDAYKGFPDIAAYHIKFQWSDQVTRAIFGVDARYEMKEEDKQIVRDHLERMLHIMHDLHSTSKIGVDFNRDYFAKRPSTVECVEWKKLHKKDLGQRFWNITSE